MTELVSCLTSLHVGRFLPASQYWDLVLHAGACFRALIGAEAVRVLLDALDLEALATSLRARIRQSEGNHKKAIKRLHVVEAFRRSGIHPTWAVMQVIPVLPPDLRPLVMLPGGRIVSSDLNTLYERVIYRNMRVRHFLALGAPTPMLHYEQRLLQDACDALFDNMRRTLPAVGEHRRSLKSLTDILKGKYGRFRRHLLGKRVDYSGRSVICVGVDLHLHQCGLPKKLALELFKPFVMRKLLDRGLARSARHAKRLVERLPVLGNYLVGLKTWEVFIAASGARKGFMDRSLNTAQSGYLTRKLVEVGMEVWTTCEDCGTQEGWLITNQESQAMGLPHLKRRAVGRVLAEAAGGVPAGTLLDASNVEHLLAAGITALRVRSPFTCEAEYGICCRCYGLDLASGALVKQGVAVGVIAGQSIGEPGTQLTMRTFHSGGIANAQGDITQGLPRVSELFEVRTPKNLAHLATYEGTVQVTRQADTGKRLVTIVATSREGHVVELPANLMLAVTEGQVVEEGTPLTPGVPHPRQLLDLLGREAAARYLITELQQVYRGTGVYIQEKHLEVIVRQMLRYMQVTDPGETELLPGDVLDRFRLHATNLHTFAQGGQPATAHPLLLGLTRAALQF